MDNPPPPTGGGGSDPDPPEPVTEVKLLTGFVIDGCTGIRDVFDVDRASAQELLPEGYTASNVSPGPAVEQARVGVQLYNCTSFTAGSYAYSDVYFGLAFIAVDAPDDAAEGDRHAYILEMLGEDDVLSAIWPAAGYPIHNGSVEYEDTMFYRTMQVDGFTIETTKGSPSTSGATNSFAWYHELENGDRLTWTGNQDIQPVDGGVANLVIPDDSTLAPLGSPESSNLVGTGIAVDAGAFTEMNLLQELAAGRE